MKKNQIVFQLPEDFFASFDDLIKFEDNFIAALPKTHDFDGHDIGSGTINFFIYTDSPEAVMRVFRKYLGTNKVEKKLRVAYRPTKGKTFTNVWPKRDTREFKYSY
jgi:hypothetical protein